MFTGIITDMGEITQVITAGGGKRLTIATNYDLKSVKLGASISHNGICLTVVEKHERAYDVELSPETLEVTTAGHWQQGSYLNLEQALKAGEELSGHIVSGHVDGTGAVQGIDQKGNYWEVNIAAPESLMPFIALKGSITVDGVSLTVNDVGKRQFTVMIIPHTWEHTIFSGYQPDSEVNLEIDMLARYVMRAMEFK